MEVFLGLFALYSIFWWIVTAVAVYWLFWGIEHDGFLVVSSCVILYILFLNFMSQLNFLSLGTLRWIQENPLLSIGIVVLYFVVGVVWSFVKWWLYIKEFVERIIDVDKLKETVKDKKKELVDSKDYDKEKVRGLINKKKPHVKDYKGRIAGWISYWPISFIWSILNDFIKRMVRQLVDYLGDYYQGITNRIFNKLIEKEKL
jgi:hypothetical protein